MPTEAEQFFYDNAGWSYDPATESEEEGRWRCARVLAEAEARLKAGPYFVDHEPDDLPWDGDVPYDGPLWIVTLYSVAGNLDGEILGSLSSVACEADDPYMRVVAAELASEWLHRAGYVCKRCNGPSPVGIGYVDCSDGAYERSAALTVCGCGYSVKVA